MPSDTDFDDFEDTGHVDDSNDPEGEVRALEAKLARARDRADRAKSAAEDERDLPDVVAPEIDEQVADAVVNVTAPQGNRAERRAAAKIPESAPKPQDHQKSSAARVAEAKNAVIVLTLWGEEIRIDRSAAVNSWDWQLGAIGKNPLQMVKGMLGEQQFFWFCARAESAGKAPMEAASEIMSLFAEESGVGTEGNS